MSTDPRAIELFRREMKTPSTIDGEHVMRVTGADGAENLGAGLDSRG